MIRNATRKPALMVLSLGATLAAAVAGCGGSGNESSDAIVIPEPGTTITTAPAPSTSGTAPAPAAGTPTESAAPAEAASTSSTAPTKAEGWGTLKGQVVFGGDPPAAGALVEQGKAAKDPEFCAKDAPIPSERLLVDGGTKGVKNVLVYLSRPSAVNDEAKKAAAAAQRVFDQSK
jgi:hypothetical protein